MMSETHIFNPNLVNEFRLDITGPLRDRSGERQHPGQHSGPWAGRRAFTGFAGPNGGTPFILLGGARRLSYAGSPTDTPSVERQNVYQILDNVTRFTAATRSSSASSFRLSAPPSRSLNIPAADTTSTANTPQNSTLVELKHL